MSSKARAAFGGDDASFRSFGASGAGATVVRSAAGSVDRIQGAGSRALAFGKGKAGRSHAMGAGQDIDRTSRCRQHIPVLGAYPALALQAFRVAGISNQMNLAARFAWR